MGNRLATTDMGRKLGGVLCPLLGGSWIPSNTMRPESRPTSIPSGSLIRPTVWWPHLGLHQRYRQTDRQRSDSIGRNRFTNGGPKTVELNDTRTTRVAQMHHRKSRLSENWAKN